MSEERFLQLFNDLDKVLKRVCQLPEGQYMDVGSLLLRAKTLSTNNPVVTHWDKLYVARQLRNLMVHEKRTGLKEVAQPSQELLAVLEEVIEQYTHPKTIWDSLTEKQATQPIWFMVGDPLHLALSKVEQEHFSQFPIFSEKGYEGLVTENGITNWLARVSQQPSQFVDCFENTILRDILYLEEKSLVVKKIYKQASLYDIVNVFEGTSASLVLVCHREDCQLKKGQDLAGLITAYDMAEIYRELG